MSLADIIDLVRPQLPSVQRPMLHFDPDEFRSKFNKQCFMIQHGLAEQAAFDVYSLIRLAKITAETRPKDLYYDEGNVTPEQRWASIPLGSLPVDETIRRIETQGAWIMIWRSDLVEPYGTLLQQALSDIFALTGREIERLIKKREVILFITSPNRVTPYHIDRECNFLLQMRGSKQISLFSRDDRDVLPEAEIEKFWACDNNAAVYRKQFQHRAQVVDMVPGVGVHIPVNAPHWVQNSNNVSVTASFNFQFHDRLRGHAYTANYYMRKLGLRPNPPFETPLMAAVKTQLGAGLSSARALYRGVGHRQ